MFTSGYQESNQSTVKIDDCNPETFATFLEWCYTDIINLSLPPPPNSPKPNATFSPDFSELAKSAESEGEEGSSLLPEMLVLADKYGAFSLFRYVVYRGLQRALLKFSPLHNSQDFVNNIVNSSGLVAVEARLREDK
jgi:hypothetical protein